MSTRDAAADTIYYTKLPLSAHEDSITTRALFADAKKYGLYTASMRKLNGEELSGFLESPICQGIIPHLVYRLQRISTSTVDVSPPPAKEHMRKISTFFTQSIFYAFFEHPSGSRVTIQNGHPRRYCCDIALPKDLDEASSDPISKDDQRIHLTARAVVMFYDFVCNTIDNAPPTFACGVGSSVWTNYHDKKPGISLLRLMALFKDAKDLFDYRRCLLNLRLLWRACHIVAWNIEPLISDPGVDFAKTRVGTAICRLSKGRMKLTADVMRVGNSCGKKKDDVLGDVYKIQSETLTDVLKETNADNMTATHSNREKCCNKMLSDLDKTFAMTDDMVDRLTDVIWFY
jgi:hypothetical protein